VKLVELQHFRRWHLPIVEVSRHEQIPNSQRAGKLNKFRSITILFSSPVACLKSSRQAQWKAMGIRRHAEPKLLSPRK